MGTIIFLVVLGLFFLVAELVFLPGVTFGVVLSLLSYGAATYMGFARMGVVGGSITLAIIVALSIVATVISLRAKTWQRLALNDKVEGKSMQSPILEVKLGDKGCCVSRLSPMGTVVINGTTYEAKSLDAYIDPRSEVEVVGVENFTVLVKKA